MSNTKTPKILAVIPARFAATRFPGKPLTLIDSVPMIERVYRNAKNCQQLDEVVVATDDPRIFNYLQSIHASVVMTATSHENGTERIAEVARTMNGYDVVINIQGDEPCVQAAQIEELIQLMLNHPHFQIGTLAHQRYNEEDISSPNRVKVGFDSQHKAVYFSRQQQNTKCDNLGIHVGMYAFRRTTLLEIVKLNPTPSERMERLEQLRWFDHEYTIGVAWTQYESPSVDVPSDVAKVEAFLQKNAPKT